MKTTETMVQKIERADLSVRKLKDKIRNISRQLVLLGRIKKEVCAECGDPKSEIHHVDYESTSNIRWLCRACHSKTPGYGRPKSAPITARNLH